MERKNKACWNCGNYKAYYTKGFCHFDQLGIGHCRKHEKIMDKQEYCEKWCVNYKFRERRKKVAIRELNEILQQISEIRQILVENEEEEVNLTE